MTLLPININEIRDEIVNLVETAEEREIPLAQIQTIFRNQCGDSARNFSGLKIKLNGIYNTDSLIKLKEVMNEFIQSHISFDDKMITIFQNIDLRNTQQKLEALFCSNEQISDSNYQIYQKQNLSKHQFLYQFQTKREITIRQDLDISDLRADIADDYQGVIGIKKVFLHCYDFVLIDFSKEILIIGIDLAKILGMNEVNISSNNFRIFLKKVLQMDFVDFNKYKGIDLFPKIQNFYNLPKNSNNGVIELYFMTDEGTAHHETAKGNNKDLRTATYHKAGIRGVRENSDITAYRITTRFYESDSDTNYDNFTEIALKSSYLDINRSNGSHLYEAFIYSVRTLEQFNTTIERLLK